MNREIKFRAWDIKNECMFDVYSISFLAGGIKIAAPGHMIDGEVEVWAVVNKGLEDRLERKAILIQFTGLLDKKESELYADDIIDITRYEETTRHQIVWEEGGWQLNPPGPFPTQYLGCFKSAIIEKIGNIHENKDLLP